MRYIWVFLAIIFCCVACKKVNNQPALDISNFPNKVGNYWIYSVQDYLHHRLDTLTISIIGNVPIQGIPATLWQYSYSTGEIDTYQVAVSSDTIRFYTYSPYPNVTNTLQFPINSSGTWSDGLHSSYWATDTSSYLSYGIVYTNGTKIIHNATAAFGFQLQDLFIIQPNIGVTYRSIYEFNNQPEKSETWQLISYALH